MAVPDIDRLREALDEPTLDMLGFSYGSMVAMGYAHAFPDRARRLVADAVADPRAPVEEWVVERAAGFDRVLNRFLAACTADPATLASNGDALLATLCVDRSFSDFETQRAAAAAAIAAAPRFGPYLSSLFLPCLDWPVGVDSFDPELESIEPMMLVSSSGDPRTPSVWAERIADRIPGRALVEVDTTAHGVSLLGVSRCVDEAVTNYLLTGDLPHDTGCVP